MIKVPPITISATVETPCDWQWIEGQTPVDFTQVLDGVGWSAEIIVWHCRDEAFRAAMTLGADGSLSISIPASVGEAMRSCRRIDAHYQIAVTGPLPDLSEVWTGPVIVQEVKA